MEIKTIQCSCGWNVRKDYAQAIIITKGKVRHYEFRCVNCGQLYFEKLNKDIIIEKS